jgi:MoxR-like ATPase
MDPLIVESAVSDQEILEKLLAGRLQIRNELEKAIVGQAEVIEQILIALFAGGH